jgi:1,4-dihydroxy-2-naphthoate octaprenyltransferase
MPIIVTLTYLFWKGAEVNWLLGVWTLVNMILFHIAGNVWSDYHDFRKGVDRDDTFGAKTLTTGMFKPKEIRNLAIGVLVIAIAGGLGLVALTGLPLLWIGIAGAALTMLYPTLKFNALGDLDILLTFAFLPTLGTAYVTTGILDWSVLWVALPVGLITDGILHSNNTRDMVPDKRADIKTMAMGLGKKASAWLYFFEVVFPFIWVAACSLAGVMPFYTVFIFLTLPVALGCGRTMLKAVTSDSDIIADLDVRTANLQLLFSVILSATFVASKFIA